MTRQEEVLKKYASPFPTPKSYDYFHKVVGAEHNHVSKKQIKDKLFSEVLQAKLQ